MSAYQSAGARASALSTVITGTIDELQKASDKLAYQHKHGRKLDYADIKKSVLALVKELVGLERELKDAHEACAKARKEAVFA